MLYDIHPGPTGSMIKLYETPEKFTVVGSVAFFYANDGVHGMELWKTDGTPSGTLMVKDIVPGSEGSYAGYGKFSRRPSVQLLFYGL